MRAQMQGWLGAIVVLVPRVLALGVLGLLGNTSPGQAQLEPEVFTASRELNKALGSNPPNLSEAVSILVGYDRPLHQQTLQSKWVDFLQKGATGSVAQKRKKMTELFDAFDDAFAAGDSGKQRAKTFIKLRDELLARSTPEAEIERSASVFVERLRKLPDAQRSLLQAFGRNAKGRISYVGQ